MIVGLAGIVALLVAAGGDERRVSFSIDQQLANSVTTVGARQPACQGPIHSQAAFSGIEFWTQPVSATQVGVTIRNFRTHLVLSRANREVIPSLQTGTLNISQSSHFRVPLDRLVPAGPAMLVCIGTSGAATLTLIGSSTSPYTGHLLGSPGAAAAFVFDRAHPRSLLLSLPTALRRAGIFKFSWFGTWAAWLLLVAVLTTLPLGAMAIARAFSDKK